MTTVDIDKLKAEASAVSARCRRANSSRQGDPILLRAADLIDSLIAKAERVDAMERALERITQLRFRHAESCAAHPEYGSAGQCTCRAYEAANLARNTLSPKESEK